MLISYVFRGGAIRFFIFSGGLGLLVLFLVFFFFWGFALLVITSYLSKKKMI